MSRYGKTPFGDNKYRIVHSTSRRHLVYPLDHLGVKEPKWIRKYPLEASRKTWVLECWQSVGEYTSGMGRDVYASKCGVCLTAEGEYDQCFEFENGVPEQGGLDKLIKWIETRHSSYANAVAIRDENDAREKAIDSSMDAAIRDRMSAFLDAPMSGYRGGRNTKTRDFRISANQLVGMPQVPGGAVMNKRKENLIHA